MGRRSERERVKGFEGGGSDGGVRRDGWRRVAKVADGFADRSRGGERLDERNGRKEGSEVGEACRSLAVGVVWRIGQASCIEGGV